MSGANVRRHRGGMEVQWQPPFISRAFAVNKYDRAHLSCLSSDKELRGRRCIDTGPYGSFISEKEPVLRLRPGRESESAGFWAVMWRTHPSTSHLLFYNSPCKTEAALGLQRADGTNDDHWENAVNNAGWASNVQGETVTCYLIIFQRLRLARHTRRVSLSSPRWCQVVTTHRLIQQLGVSSCV